MNFSIFLISAVFNFISLTVLNTDVNRYSNFSIIKFPQHDIQKVDGIEITNAWMRVSASGMNSAAYCEIKNNSDSDDQILSVACSFSKVVQIHETYKKGEDMGMRKAGDIIIKKGNSFTLKPGSFHIMLIKLKEDLKSGDSKELIFKFKNAGEIKTTFNIKN